MSLSIRKMDDCVVLINAYRGQLWIGKQKQVVKIKIESGSNIVKSFAIIKFQVHSVIVKMAVLGA